MNHIRQKLFSY